MVLSCEITFDDNLNGIYFSGQTLSGKVEIKTDKVKSVRGICLSICGNAKCHWTETNGSNKNSESYDGRDDYLSSTTYLLGSPNGQSLDIPIGDYSYTFACVLPTTLPSSFEGSYGRIRYTVRVALERPWKFDQTYKVAFTVLKQLDLNYDSPDLRIPSQVEKTKTFCCWPCESGPLLITASIPQSGYVPGQKISITVNLTNSSNVDIYEIKCSLNKLITYHSDTPCYKTNNEVLEGAVEKCPGTPPFASSKSEIILVVPAVPPTNMTSCRIIGICYEICIEIKASDGHTNSELRIPITIGTTPLNMAMQPPFNASMGGYQLLQAPLAPYPVTQQPYPGQQPTGVIGFSGGMQHDIGFSLPPGPIFGPGQNFVPVPNSSYPNPNTPQTPENLGDIPPPSYEECSGGQKQITDDEDKNAISQKPYSPRYPVYNFENASAPPHSDTN